ncbi:MAG: hypothetical protein ABSG26_07380 [Bryobacteraceae bacterium]|jgi:hypothetical protein
MRQALHIFKKDARHLWIEIAVTLLVVAAFTFTSARRAFWMADPVVNRNVAGMLLTFLLPLAWWILIARLVHAETLPGDRQFWTTRPYAWKSLLAAKALFVAAFVNLPLLAAHIAILLAYGFNPLAEIPGLLWSQVLITAVLVLPIAALSALTTGFVQLLITGSVLCLALVAWNIGMPSAGLDAGWRALEWIRSYYEIAVLALAALAILVWQYARRRTAAARWLAVAAVVLMALDVLIPWTAAFALQSRLSKQPIDPASLRIDFDSAKQWAARALIEKGDRVWIEIPITIAGIPAGMSPRYDGAIMAIEASDGSTWPADQQPWSHVTTRDQVLWLQATVDGGFYRKVKDQPVKLRGAMYLTLYGNLRVTEVPFSAPPMAVPGRGLCTATPGAGRKSYYLICSSVFLDPEGPATYSPFPADLALDPVNSHRTYIAAFYYPFAAFTAATVGTTEPLAHLRRDFEIGGLRLGDFEVRQRVP